jgi:hypothetical protein
MKTIYLVEGETGEYEDRFTWNVCAFTEEEDAMKMVETMNDIAAEIGNGRQALNSQIKNPYDTDMSVDTTGVSYSYYPIELRNKFIP